MIAKTAITIFNKYYVDGKEQYQRTVLYNTHFDMTKSNTQQQSNTTITLGDSVWAAIPFKVRATNGRTYLSPSEWRKSDMKTMFFTLRKSDKIVRAEILVDYETMKDLSKDYADVYTIHSINTCDFSSKALRHWEVVAK